MARGMHLLTAAEVKAARAPAMLHDGRGLYLQVEAATDLTAPAQRSWLFRYTVSATSKRRWMGLGSADSISLKQARDAADAARRQLEAGIDPIDLRKVERIAQAVEAAHASTFKQSALEYLTTKRGDWRSEKHAKLWLASLEAYVFPRIGALPVSALDTSRQGVAYIKRVLSPIWHDKPETGRRVRQRLEAILEYASAHGYRGEADNPARLSRVEHIMGKSPRAVQHHPALPFEQAGAFMEELRGLDGLGAAALELCTLTATRTIEVLGARWVEFDLDTAVWTIPETRMKAGREHRVPLPRQAIGLLRKLRAADPKGVLVFPGLGTKTHLSGMAMLAVLKRMKRTDLTVHGFRSTFRDWAGERTSFPREVAEAALAHSLGDKTEAAYRRGDALEKRRQLMQSWADYCDVPSAQSVIDLQEAKARRASEGEHA